MELNRILIKRKKLFISKQEGWSRPLSVEKFVNNYIDFEERGALISDKEKIVFIDKEENPMSFEEGYSQYKMLEEEYLDKVLETQQAYFESN